MKDRRQFQRSPQPLHVQYRVMDELVSPWEIGRSADISATGLRLQTGSPLAPGERLEMDVSLPSAQVPLHITGVVVWSRVPPNGPPECGIEFRNVTHPQQLQIDQMVQFLEP